MDLGYAWLKNELRLPDLPLPHASKLGSIRRSTVTADGAIEEYTTPYVPKTATAIGHLEFALKYDGINLPVLWHALRSIPATTLLQHICENPGSKYARTMGFFYEMLTGEQLAIDFPLSGAYALIADPEQYITSEPVTVGRWRVKDNLLGDVRFCPMVARTPETNEMLTWSPLNLLDQLRAEYPPDLFVRAASWLYLAETKSSNEIEREHPAPNRAQRFVQLLRDAGKLPLVEAMTEETLEKIQEAVVDPGKRTLIGLRGIQNYVGPGFTYGSVPQVDYPCPPPDSLSLLIAGLSNATQRCTAHPLLRASVASFGLVFLHPFEDGNGRVSRYLIHDMCTRDGLTPEGFIFPVSAVMLQHIDRYKTVLEQHSKPIRRLAALDFDEELNLTILNPEIVEPLFRYPDLTRQTAYLYDITRTCAEKVVVHEIDVLKRFEGARLATRETLDLPDRRLNELIGLIHQNGGKLSANKRKSRFVDLNDDEVQTAEASYETAFAREPAPPEADPEQLIKS